MSVVIGLLALIFFIAAMAYSILKTQKKLKINLFAAKSHCLFGYFALIIGLYHSISASKSIDITLGYLSICLLILSTAFGILMKYTKPNRYKRHTHIIICILTLLVILLHMYSKLLF